MNSGLGAAGARCWENARRELQGSVFWAKYAPSRAPSARRNGKPIVADALRAKRGCYHAVAIFGHCTRCTPAVRDSIGTLTCPLEKKCDLGLYHYDVQLDEPRPQFGQERQKKNRLLLLFCLSRAYSEIKKSSCTAFKRWRRCFEPPPQPLPRPCIHACAHPRAIIRTGAACATSDAQLTSSAVRRPCSQARYPAGADGLEEEIICSSSDNFGTFSDKSV